METPAQRITQHFYAKPMQFDKKDHWSVELLYAGTCDSSSGDDPRYAIKPVHFAAHFYTSHYIGGREGNNAFLKFEPETERISPGELLIGDGMSYKDIVKLSKEANVSSGEIAVLQKAKTLHKCFLLLAININVQYMDNMVVVATRLGLLDVASAFAEGPARSNLNDLHRETLKQVAFEGYNLRNPALPERILPVSVLKKGYNNANITPLHTAAINPNVKVCYVP
ncbi:unnamed protein product, partial [Strongylus vulgaris]